MQISFYNNTFDKRNAPTDPLVIIEYIRSDSLRETILYLRSLGKNEYKAEKTSRLPAVTWSGKFKDSERSINTLEEYSFLMCMDFDKMDKENTILVKQQLSSDPNVLCVFTSPSGAGLKVLVPVDSAPENHRTAWLHLADYFLKTYFIEADRSGKDVSRLCYLSWDPDMWYNPNATVFHVEVEKYSEVFTEFKKTASESISDERAEHAWKVATKWIEDRNGYTYQEGSRNMYIHAMACALNRIGVLMETTISLIDRNLQTPDRKWLQSVNSAYKHQIAEHGTVELANIASGVHTFTPVPYNEVDETNDVVLNDLVYKCMMLMYYKVPMNELMDVLIKLRKYYDKLGLLGQAFPDVYGISAMAREQMNSNVANNAAQFAMEVHTPATALTEVSKQEMSGALPTYLPAFDEAMGGGMLIGNAYGLVGYGETFKSIFSQYMQVCDSANEIPSLYLNGEMSVVQYLERAVKMTLGIDLRPYIRNKENDPQALQGIIEKMMEYTKNFMMFSSGTDFNKNSILATLDKKYAETGKKVRRLYIDGIGQMEWLTKNEIESNIKNSYILKEIAKEAYGGEGVCVVCLMHCSGADRKTLRNTATAVRGGTKVTANLDGYFCTSLFIDEDSLNEDNPEDFTFLPGKFHVLMRDKRNGALETRAAVQVGANLHLEIMDVSPAMLEVNIKKKFAANNNSSQSY